MCVYVVCRFYVSSLELALILHCLSLFMSFHVCFLFQTTLIPSAIWKFFFFSSVFLAYEMVKSFAWNFNKSNGLILNVCPKEGKNFGTQICVRWRISTKMPFFPHFIMTSLHHFTPSTFYCRSKKHDAVYVKQRRPFNGIKFRFYSKRLIFFHSTSKSWFSIQKRK